MELTPVAKKDLKPLLELVKACTPELKALDEKALEAQTLGDPDHDGSFLLQGLENRKPVAVGLGVARKGPAGKSGYVKFFGVHPKHRGRHLAHELFTELERRFQKRECREIWVGPCPAPYLLDGVNCLDTAAVCFLLKRGYERKGEAVDMAADLSKAALDLPAEDLAKAKAAKIHRAKPDELEKAMILVRASFPQWGWELRNALKSGDLFLAEKGGKAVAFACANATHPGWLGPMGTLESERGQGLGRILLLTALQALKKQGHKQPVIPWVGPIGFYARHAAAGITAVRWQFIKRV